MEIITNNVPRAWVTFQCLPKKIQEQVAENYENARYFYWVKYKGWWYCPDDFMIIGKNNPLHEEGWHGYASDTNFSGVLVRFTDDEGNDEGRVVFGRYYS